MHCPSGIGPPDRADEGDMMELVAFVGGMIFGMALVLLAPWWVDLMYRKLPVRGYDGKDRDYDRDRPL